MIIVPGASDLRPHERGWKPSKASSPGYGARRGLHFLSEATPGYADGGLRPA